MQLNKPKGELDRIMLETWHCLRRDFRSFEVNRNPSTLRFTDQRRCSSPKEVRDFCDGIVTGFNCDAQYYKRSEQLKSFFKRYIFEEDVNSSRDLLVSAVSKFTDTQIRLKQYLPDSPTIRAVLGRARFYVRGVLGEYSLEEHFSSSRFSRNATTLSPRSRSGLDQKITGLVSGSEDHIRWFKDYLKTDDMLSECVGTLTLCKTLQLAFAPKTFKSLRTITPNTTIGSFYTYGLGKMVERRLKRVRIDLSIQQERHRRWIRKYSVDRSHATADLSAASDSFTAPLINALVPRKWYNVFKFGRLASVAIDGVGDSYLNSFMAMGIGFTFPLQTLLFWALLVAIRDFSGTKGRVSVFGDDLIYPTKMHTYVKAIFGRLGFVLNQDKTFVNEHFRESCGSDYYHGTDVRGAMPQLGSKPGGRMGLLMELYKLHNSLLRRWNVAEIQSTVHYLHKELLRLSPSGLHVVPPDYPDHSGLKVVGDYVSWWIPEKWVYHENTFSWAFRYLSVDFDLRPVENVQVYLWDTLRARDQREVVDIFSSTPREVLFWRGNLFKWVRVRAFSKDGTEVSLKIKKLRPFAPIKDTLRAKLATGLTTWKPMGC